MGSSVILITPGSADIKLLGPTAASVWRELKNGADFDQLSLHFSALYPQIDGEERNSALRIILSELEADGFVGRC